MPDAICGIFSELTQVGGIQQVSRHAGATLTELAEEEGRPCELLGLNDPAGEGSFRVGDREYRFRGFSRNKAGLAVHLLRRAAKTGLVLAGHVNLGPLALPVKAVRGQSRVWIMAYGLEVWEPLPSLRRMALLKADGVIAVSGHTAEAVSRVQGIASGKIAVLRPALDPSYFSPYPGPVRWPAPPGSRSILTVARLPASESGKGIDTVILALPQLVARFPNLYYVVIGDGDGQPGLAKLAADCGVGERVIFLGSSPGCLRGYYEAADVFAMPSGQEGFGIVYLEAMAAGKPVVGGDAGGAPEAIDDGETGFLVKHGDVQELGARLSILLADDGLRQRMGDAGRRKVLASGQYEDFRRRLGAILGSRCE